jgi:hypothetical protein
VLSYSLTLIVYLRNADSSLRMITVAGAVGSIFEISSMFIFLWGIRASLSMVKHVRMEETRLLLRIYKETEGQDRDKPHPVHSLEVGIVKTWGMKNMGSVSQPSASLHRPYRCKSPQTTECG